MHGLVGRITQPLKDFLLLIVTFGMHIHFIILMLKDLGSKTMSTKQRCMVFIRPCITQYA